MKFRSKKISGKIPQDDSVIFSDENGVSRAGERFEYRIGVDNSGGSNYGTTAVITRIRIIKR